MTGIKVIAVDDEQIVLEDLKRHLHEIAEIREVTAFTDSGEALQWLEKNQADVAFLDIRMRNTDGLTLAKKLKEIQPACAVIFISGFSEYAVQAFQLHVFGYLMKPVTIQDIRRELSHLYQPQIPAAPPQKIVRVQCFGNFEVFINDELAKFRYSKSKELFAYLIDRMGAAIEAGELCAVLWENRPDSHSLRSQLRNSIADLTRCMSEAGATDVLRKSRNSLAVNTQALDCDYYSFLRIEPGAVNTYKGEYMTQYSWAEMTLGGLERLQRQ